LIKNGTEGGRCPHHNKIWSLVRLYGTCLRFEKLFFTLTL
jgi:hypothetical protein